MSSPALEYTPDGFIKIAAEPLLREMPDDHKLRLIDTLACEEVVIQYVTQQILDGWTEQSSHGRKGIDAQAVPTCALDKAVREVARRAGEVAEKEIGRLEAALKRSEERVRELEDERLKLAAQRQYLY